MTAILRLLSSCPHLLADDSLLGRAFMFHHGCCQGMEVLGRLQEPACYSSYETWDVVLKTGGSFLLFACLFGLLRIVVVPRSVAKESRTSWALKCISLTHALIVAPTVIWALLAEPGTVELTRAVWRFDATHAKRCLVYAVSPTAARVVPVTMGYFIFDLLLLQYWEGTPEQWLPMILHHGISLLTWPLGLVYPACHYFLLVCISMEASTPFVQLRWMIRQHTSKDGVLYYVNGVIMTLSFLACRVATIPHNVWAILVGAPHTTTSGLPTYMRLATSVLIIPSILNLYWARIMVKGLVTIVTKKSVQKAEETVLCKTKAA